MPLRCAGRGAGWGAVGLCRLGRGGAVRVGAVRGAVCKGWCEAEAH